MIEAIDSARIVALEAADLSYSYPGEREALRRVTFAIPRGAFVGLLGPIGAGKTTLLECCAGLRAVTGAVLTVDGTSLLGSARSVLPSVALISAGIELPRDEHVADLLSWFARTRPAWDEALAQSLRVEFDLPLRMPIGALSRGQKNLVATLCTLAARPRILLLDEPLVGLDVAMREVVIRRLLARVYEDDATIVAASHDLAELEGAVDHLIVLEEGEIRAHGSLEALQSRFCRVMVSGDTAGIELVRGSTTWWDVERAGRIMSGTTLLDIDLREFAASVESIAGIDEVRVESLSLRDLYLAIKGVPQNVAKEAAL